MSARRLPPPRVAVAAPARRDPAEQAVERLRRAKRELEDAHRSMRGAEAERVERYAIYEKARDEAQKAIDDSEVADERFLRATETFTAALADAHTHGLAAMLAVESERLHYVDVGDEAEGE